MGVWWEDKEDRHLPKVRYLTKDPRYCRKRKKKNIMEKEKHTILQQYGIRLTGTWGTWGGGLSIFTRVGLVIPGPVRNKGRTDRPTDRPM